MAKAPEDRFERAGLFAEALTRGLEGESEPEVEARARALAERERQPAR